MNIADFRVFFVHSLSERSVLEIIFWLENFMFTHT